MSVGSRIREHREAAGMSQEQLAERCLVSRQTISNWERDRTLPDIESLKVIADEFGTTVDALIGSDLPRIARRADAEARRILALLAVDLVWLVLMSIDLIAPLPGPWAPLYALALGFCLASNIVLWRVLKRNNLRYYPDIGRYLDKNLILRDSWATRLARALLRHIQILVDALVIAGVFLGLAAGGVLTLPVALITLALLIPLCVYGLNRDRDRQVHGKNPSTYLPPQR